MNASCVKSVEGRRPGPLSGVNDPPLSGDSKRPVFVPTRSGRTLPVGGSGPQAMRTVMVPLIGGFSWVQVVPASMLWYSTSPAVAACASLPADGEPHRCVNRLDRERVDALVRQPRRRPRETVLAQVHAAVGARRDKVQGKGEHAHAAALEPRRRRPRDAAILAGQRSTTARPREGDMRDVRIAADGRERGGAPVYG